MIKITAAQKKFLTEIQNGKVERSPVHTVANNLNKKGLMNYSYGTRQWHITQAGIEQIKGGKA